jgi:hypothetical protein
MIEKAELTAESVLAGGTQMNGGFQMNGEGWKPGI